MRATISFEADVSRVNDIMRSLVLEESNALQDALIALEKATADRIVEGISEALEHIQGVATQLEQYRQMMVSFEQARFETMLPQPVAPLPVAPDLSAATAETQSTTEAVARFNEFLEKIQTHEEDGEEGASLEEG